MVYFVQGKITGNIKIGNTDAERFPKRFNEFQSSDQLVCLNTIADGDAALERELQDRFAFCHSHGGWFKPAPELLLYIDSLTIGEFAYVDQFKTPNQKRKGSTASTRAERLKLEQQYKALGAQAFTDGLDSRKAIGEGKKYTTLWHATRSNWKWGYEQAAIASGIKSFAKRRHIDSRLNPNEPDED